MQLHEIEFPPEWQITQLVEHQLPRSSATVYRLSDND